MIPFHYGNLILHIIGVQGFAEVPHAVKIAVSLDYVVPIFTFLLTKKLSGIVYHSFQGSVNLLLFLNSVFKKKRILVSRSL